MTEEIRGTVAVVNSKGTGLKLVGEEGWRNYTQEQYRKNKPWPTPQKGDEVLLTIVVGAESGREFVQSLKVVKRANQAGSGQYRSPEQMMREAAINQALTFAHLQMDAGIERSFDLDAILADADMLFDYQQGETAVSEEEETFE